MIPQMEDFSDGTMDKNTALIQAASGAGNPNQGLVPAGFFALFRASDTIAVASERSPRSAQNRCSVSRIFYRSQLRVSYDGTANPADRNNEAPACC
jgi:hypothetical protein